MPISCQCRVISTAQFERALDIHEPRMVICPGTLRRDASAVFRTAKTIAAQDADCDGSGGQRCCGACLPTVERMIQARGHHTEEPVDTTPDPSAANDTCPFPVLP